MITKKKELFTIGRLSLDYFIKIANYNIFLIE